jgi:hypothetical protein
MVVVAGTIDAPRALERRGIVIADPEILRSIAKFDWNYPIQRPF